jgi:hypothetical protein
MSTTTIELTKGETRMHRALCGEGIRPDDPHIVVQAAC